jgi:predicted metal-dependent TIM-barrel fold hydrolase
MLNKELGIEDVVIERAHRNGFKKTTDDGKNISRTITMRLLNYKDKCKILDKFIGAELWKKNIYINEDFSKKTADKRRELFQQVKEMKSRGVKAKVVYNKIVVAGNSRNVYESQRNIDH